MSQQLEGKQVINKQKCVEEGVHRMIRAQYFTLARPNPGEKERCVFEYVEIH